MATFRYSIPGGVRTSATIDAPDRASAVRLLMQRGEAPTRIEEITPSLGGEKGPDPARAPGAEAPARGLAAPRLFAPRVMNRAQLAQFVRELATAVNAGLPLIQGLKTIARQGRTPAQKQLLMRLIDDVEHGRSLSDAMRSVGPPFSELVISLVGAGELAGRLGEVLVQAARLMERDAKLRASLLGAMLYPAIIAGAVGVAVVIVVTIIVPRVLAAVSGQLAVLPLPTRIVQGVAEFLGSWWPALLLGVLAAAWWGARLYAQPGPRLSIDRALLRLPAVGKALRDVAVARFTRTLGTLLSAGLPVVPALRVTRGTLANRALERAVDEVCDEVQAGRTIAEPLERTGWFPPLLVQIVGMGEQTGKLDEMLGQAADAFEDQTEQSIKVLTTVLPPMLIIVLACVVGFVVLAILLPLIELQESIG